MNGIEKITQRITADAQAEIDLIQAEAKAQCDKIAKDSDAAAQEEYWKIFKKGTKDAELRVERLGSVAALEAKKQMLAEKQDIVSLAFDRAVEQLLALPDDKYVAFLAKLASNASRTGSESIVLSADDRAKHGSEVCAAANKLLASAGKPASLTLSDKTGNFRGGLILSEGSIEMNCSFEVLVNMRRPELSGEVAKILFD